MKRARLYLLGGILVVLLAGIFLKSRISQSQAELPWPGPTSTGITEIVIAGASNYAITRHDPARDEALQDSWFIRCDAGGEELPPEIAAGSAVVFARADARRLHELFAILVNTRPLHAPQGWQFPEDASPPFQVTMRSKAKEWNFTVSANPLPREEETGTSVILASCDGHKAVPLQVDAGFVRLLRKPARWYADTRLFSLAPDAVSRLEITWPSGEAWQVARGRDGAFALAQTDPPHSQELPQTAVEYLLHTALGMRSPEMFAAADTASLPDPLLRLRLWEKEGTPEELVVYRLPVASARRDAAADDFTQAGFSQGELFLGFSSWEGGCCILPSELLTLLGRSLSMLRAQPLLRGALKDISAARLSLWDRNGGRTDISFEKRGDVWREKGNETPVIGMETLFWRLNALQGERSIQSENDVPAATRPLASWTFATRQGSVTLDFRVSPDGRRYWVSSGGGSWYRVPALFIHEMLGRLPAPNSNGEAEKKEGAAPR